MSGSSNHQAPPLNSTRCHDQDAVITNTGTRHIELISSNHPTWFPLTTSKERSIYTWLERDWDNAASVDFSLPTNNWLGWLASWDSLYFPTNRQSYNLQFRDSIYQAHPVIKDMVLTLTSLIQVVYFCFSLNFYRYHLSK